jgi:mRNA guanylyltransferase
MDGTSLLDRSLDKRLAYARQRLFAPYHKLFEDFPGERQYQPFLLMLKEFGLGYGIEQIFKQVIPHLRHGNDGLIFTCRNTPYKHGTDPHILKWKPAEENTIDCRMKLTFPTVEPTEAERKEGITEPFIDYDSVPKAELYIFTGNSGPEKYEPFSNLYITEAEWETLKGLGDPLNDRIVECHQDEQKHWRIVRFRDDKDEANHKSTVLSVLDSINDCVSFTELCKLSQRIRDNWKARQGVDPNAKKPPG